jgi:hypothetical protein
MRRQERELGPVPEEHPPIIGVGVQEGGPYLGN